MRKRLIKKINEHYKDCVKEFSKKVEGVDYVSCKICNQKAQKLNAHLKSCHDMTGEEYSKKYSVPTICSNASTNYLLVAKNNGDWINRANEQGTDLTEYKKKMGKAVSEAILNNPEEIARRSAMMTDLNSKQQETEEFKKIVSDTAKATSAHPEIQQQRSATLKAWRDKDPLRFRTLCTDKMHSTWQSKPEKKLGGFLATLEDFAFKNNQVVKSDSFSSKSKRKQLDFLDLQNKIYVEYDGHIHFKNFFNDETLVNIKLRDFELNSFILENKYILIRISYDQWVDKKTIEKSYFKSECLEKIKEILEGNQPGVYKIGEAYGEH